MTSDAHAVLILRTIREHANEKGLAWWADVGPALEPFGLGWDNVVAVRDRGYIERSREIGLLRLTSAGLSRITR